MYTLQAIAEHGADAFYTGAFAESMVKTIQETNGTITLDDYKNYDVISREVLHTDSHTELVCTLAILTL
ncbi:hypothetical protein LB503_009337 [Fusarium chuoi]|nr:hypothetical protein LB503_009337 [Fusarium chuoi]